MKKIVLCFALFFGVLFTSKAQVLFSTAQTLSHGNWSIGLNPVYADIGGGDFAFFFHGGYGLGSNSDLGLKLGFGWGDAYVGLDYEKTLLTGKPSVSLHGGAHYWNDFGLDLGSTVTFPIGNVKISSGLDLDVDFGHDANDDFELYAPLWLPISLEVYLQKHLSIVFEGNIKLTHSAFTTVGGGLNIYF
jgi:hypothetical protein